MSSFINPLSDIFIKYLLGSEKNKDLLLSFINAVLEDAGLDKIVDVTIRNPFNVKEFTIDKESVVDVKALDEKHRQYNIEIQVDGDDIFRNRSLYYWARIYTGQLKEKEIYGQLYPVICINLLNFVLLKDLPKLHSCFVIREKDEPYSILTDHLIMHFIELPKFTDTRFIDHFTKWLAFLKYEGKEEKVMETLLNDETIRKAHEAYHYFTADDELREKYEARAIWKMDYETKIAISEKKGEEKGKIAIAKSLYTEGIPLETISKCTGLSREELEQILKIN